MDKGELRCQDTWMITYDKIVYPYFIYSKHQVHLSTTIFLKKIIIKEERKDKREGEIEGVRKEGGWEGGETSVLKMHYR